MAEETSYHNIPWRLDSTTNGFMSEWQYLSVVQVLLIKEDVVFFHEHKVKVYMALLVANLFALG